MNNTSIKPDAVTSEGSEIFIVDDLNPEAVAMAQALYSRDPQSVVTHISKIQEVGWQKFMATYYVGYGHKSIGDCGSTTLFIENISMLAAKAIQDWQLYKGQEASTRYLDMSKQKVLNPLASKEGQEIQDKWMGFYNKALAELIEHYKKLYPRHDDEKETVYEKAIKAKAFDAVRGFLPAGATTYASWHTDLRQAHDQVKNLEHHQLPEVREIGAAIRESLMKRYTSSFGYKLYDEQEKYYDMMSMLNYYDRSENALEAGFSAKSMLDMDGLMSQKEFLEKRPEKTNLPIRFAKYGSIKFSFPLDYGSFRDLQRHRNGVCEMPLLSTRHGFFPWYLQQLTPALKEEAGALIKEQEAAIAALRKADGSPADDYIKQYYVAMGYTVACEVTYSLPQTIYVAELRAGQTVHSTLRVVAQQMSETVRSLFPDIPLYADMTEDEWNIKRGTQDIIKKGN